jgi:hypothetical protein
LIVFVFDPLAIAMVIAANFAFGQIKPKKEKDVPSPHYSPQPFIPKEVIMKELEKETKKEEPKKDVEQDIYEEKPKPKETLRKRGSGYWF